MITFALAQHDFLVGGLKGNLRKALGLVTAAREAGADLLVFPELALAGYPPEDLLLRPGFLEACDDAVQQLASEVSGIDVVFGHPRMEHGKRYNSASWIREGRIIGRYDKQHLP
ncbi:MAG: NAD+ synthase, partial [Xanthomonadales bacterium]|nr:NAD+ synthase [Xanthomonadales bacterium]